MSEQNINFDLLQFKFQKGLKHYRKDKDPIYLARAEFELGIITQTKFESYFLIVADICAFMRRENIAHMIRGSGCGSLCVWSLFITHPWLDPVAIDLPFERFLNPDRVSNPDIDMDIDDSRRAEVIEYTMQKYGADYVARLCNFGSLGAKAAVKDIGRALELPNHQEITNEITGFISNKPGTKLEDEIAGNEQLQNYQRMYPELFYYAMQVEGKVRQPGQHAAGVIITPEPLWNYLPTFYKSSDDSQEPVPITQWDMYDTDYRGLLKMDYLGLKTVGVIQKTCEAVKAWNVHTGAEPFDIYAIPQDDLKTWEAMGRGELSGIFQVERQFVRKFARRMNLQTQRNIAALSVLIAIIRPGTMDSGMTEVYLQRTDGKEAPDPPHLLLAKSLKDSYGVIVFQEQVMSACRDMAGMTGAEADTVRRGVGKKQASVIAQMKPKFVAGAIKNNATEEDANRVWALLETFGRYGFCLDGNTLLDTPHGDVPIAKIKAGDCVYRMDDAGGKLPVSVIRTFDNGIKECARYWFDDGSFLDCTPDHKVATRSGKVKIHTVHEQCMRVAGVGGVYRKIVRCDKLGSRHVYDIEVDHPTHHYLLSNGVCVSNCKGHSAAYAVVGYQTAYLKTHYPLIFMTCLINSEAGSSDRDRGYNFKVAEYAEESRRLGIKIALPCVRKSTPECTIDVHENTIYFGLSLIKDVSASTAKWINENSTQARTFAEFCLSCYQIRPTGKKTTRVLKGIKMDTENDAYGCYSMVGTQEMRALIWAGALDRFVDGDMSARPKLMAMIETMMGYAKKACNLIAGQYSGKRSSTDPNELLSRMRGYVDDHYEAMTLEQLLEKEKQATGCFLSHSPFTPFMRSDSDYAVYSDLVQDDDAWSADEFITIALLSSLREHVTKKGKQAGRKMAFASLSIIGGDLDCVMFADTYDRISTHPWPLEANKVYEVQVKRDRKKDSHIIVDMRRLSEWAPAQHTG